MPPYVGCMRFEATIDVAASAQLLFEVYTDVERWPEWTASVTSVERLDQGPLSVGSRARIKQPRLPAAVWEVTEVVAGHSFTWMARVRGLSLQAVMSSPRQPVGAGQVTASLEQAGLLGPLLGFLTKQLTNRYLHIELRGLKAHFGPAFCRGSAHGTAQRRQDRRLANHLVEVTVTCVREVGLPRDYGCLENRECLGSRCAAHQCAEF